MKRLMENSFFLKRAVLFGALWMAFSAFSACAGEDTLSGSSSGSSGSYASSSSGSASSSSSASSGGSGGASSGSGGAGGGTGDTCMSVVDALRGDLQGTLGAKAAESGWPLQVDNGNTFVFVSVDPSLSLLAGDFNAWTGAAMTKESGFSWMCAPAKAGDGYKFTNNTDWVADPWSRSYNYDQFGEISLIQPTKSHLDRHFDVKDANVVPRTVRVWVPEGGYSRVLYVHDGQNLFDPDAFFGGWKLQESAPAGMLLVGIDNTPDRMDEYTHVVDMIQGMNLGGKGDAYAAFVQSTVRPLIQKTYGETGPIGTMGSSLGGLISFHIAYQYPGEYAFAASLSGTMGWGSISLNNETMIERYAKKGHQSTYLYLDSGGGATNCVDADMDGILDDDPTAEDNYCENIQLRDTLESVGYTLGTDLAHWWETGAPHNEAAWAARVFRPLDIFAGL